jgi:4-hydroxy-3-methylbut-2-enyl diphosphate reductase
VNADLQEKGVRFLQDTHGKQVISFDEITGDDVVLIPAFGTTLDIETMLKNKGIQIEKYNTTCPFVEKVWNRGEQLAQKGYSIVVHGKPKHEETRATFSHASYHTPTIVVNDMKEAIELAKYITGEKPEEQFYEEFKGRYSRGFEVQRHLQRFGVINQTTQLASDTQAIAEYLKKVVMHHFNLTEENIDERFADTRDTLCYATLDNQTAVGGMLETDADIAIVIGGYNSSNTSHLVELCEEKLPTYFINDADKILSKAQIIHADWRTKLETVTHDFLPAHSPVKVLITSGASCPDALVEDVIRKLVSFYETDRQVDEVIAEMQAAV